MKFHSLSRRTLAAGAVSAVALGGALVAAPAAQAATIATNVYTCAIPAAFGGPQDVTFATQLSTPIGDLPPSIQAGMDIGAGLLEVKNHVTFNAATYNVVKGFDSVELTKYAATVGPDTSVAATVPAVATTAITANTDGTYSADLNGKNAEAFNAPAAGKYDVLTPTTFDLVVNKAGLAPVAVSCTIKTGTTPASLGSLETLKNAATVKTKKKISVMSGKDAKIKVKVTADNETPSGKLVAMIGKKKVGKATLKNGKAVVKIKAKKLRGSKVVVKLKYLGDGYTSKAKGKTVVWVTI